MVNFNERLKEIMLLDNKNSNDLAEYLNVKDISSINCWLRGEYLPSYEYVLKMADYFEVSLDYLVGRSGDVTKTKFKNLPPFRQQIKNVLKELKTSQYKLIKDNIISRNSMHMWCTLGNDPQIKTLIKLADYFNISLDYLVGRE